MNYITQTVLVTLLVITAVLSTSLVTAGEVTSTDASVHRRQHNAHINRHHNNHHHHHHHQQHQQQQHQIKRINNNEKRERLQNIAHPDENFEFINDAAHRQHQQQQQQQQSKRNVTATTRLRRLGPREYYNKVTQRRLNTKNGAVGRNNEWSYNNYNVHTNTFGGPSYNSGKGDDNTQDVEFIGANSNNNEWSSAGGGHMPGSTPPRRYDPVTVAPPPLVPARRGYDILTPTTVESPVTEANTIDRNSANDPKDMEK